MFIMFAGMRLGPLLVFILVAVLSATKLPIAQADGDFATPVEAVSNGQPLLNIRPRFEDVDQAGKPERAQAWTMRTLLGWETAGYHGLAATLQLINVSRLSSKDFNDSTALAAKSPFPLVADPDYSGISDTRVRAGKQSIKLDNVRFVGNVEFRQVMQVFNGVTVENASLPGTDLYLGHLQRIRNVFGQEIPTHIDILHAAYKLSSTEHLTGYGYFQKQPITGSNTGLSDNSNRIAGVRLDGSHPFAATIKVLYTAEYARQRNFDNGDARIDAKYDHFGIGLAYGMWFARVDRETLGSNGGLYAFQTPLGTNHLFQGWADLFLTTPKQGLRDSYLSIGGQAFGAQIYSELHQFKSDFGSINFGREIDLGMTYAFSKQLTAKLEYADFREGDVLTPTSARKRDTTKTWVTLVYNY